MKKQESNKKESFFKRIKEDKKYSAKVQLISYGVFILILIVVLNAGNTGSSLSSNTAHNGALSNTTSNDENASLDGDKSIENITNNYVSNVTITLNRKSMNTETNESVITEEKISYKTKSYNDKLEINKTKEDVSTLYYKVDNNYYSKIDNITSYVKDSIVYDVIDAEYVEFSNILKLIDKAGLDYITTFSSGKKESLYVMKVKDLLITSQSEDKVEIKVEEESNNLKLNIDYSNLFKVMDESIDTCILDIVVTDIDKVEDFEVIVNNVKEENASVDTTDE